MSVENTEIKINIRVNNGSKRETREWHRERRDT